MTDEESACETYGNLGNSYPIFPASPNAVPSTAYANGPFSISTGPNDQTYNVNAPENQQEDGVSTDNPNIQLALRNWRPPPEIDPLDKPSYDTPNCDGQKSKDFSHQKFLSCCNEDKSQCVYFKWRHPLCIIPRKTKVKPRNVILAKRAPKALAIQCCDDVPEEGGQGVECRDANNPFDLRLPAIDRTIPPMRLPWGETPPVRIYIPPKTIEFPKGPASGESPVEAPPP
ncbi:hypothetical protein MMC07_003938 [Pseudocyphellaria aurata]|nr:hypothetical protein [Pseudocyphellaria aurata]